MPLDFTDYNELEIGTGHSYLTKIWYKPESTTKGILRVQFKHSKDAGKRGKTGQYLGVPPSVPKLLEDEAGKAKSELGSVFDINVKKAGYAFSYIEDAEA